MDGLSETLLNLHMNFQQFSHVLGLRKEVLSLEQRFYVSKNANNYIAMTITRKDQELTYDTYREGNVRLTYCEIIQLPYQPSISSWIAKRFPLTW